MYLPDVIRVLTLFYGGVIAGVGLSVCRHRASLWKRLGDPASVRAAWTLAAVNALIVVYVAFVFRWNHHLSYRWILSVVIFTVKGYLFYNLRKTALNTERKSL